MTDAQLFETRAYADLAFDLLVESEKYAPLEFQSTVKIDLKTVQEERQLLADAIAKHKDAPISSPEDLGLSEGARWMAKAVAGPDAAQNYRTACWFALEAYPEYASPNVAAMKLREQLVLRNLGDQIAVQEECQQTFETTRESARPEIENYIRAVDKLQQLPTAIDAKLFADESVEWHVVNADHISRLEIVCSHLGQLEQGLVEANTAIQISLSRLAKSTADVSKVHKLQSRFTANLSKMPKRGEQVTRPLSPYVDTTIATIKAKVSDTQLKSRQMIQQAPQFSHDQHLPQLSHDQRLGGAEQHVG